MDVCQRQQHDPLSLFYVNFLSGRHRSRGYLSQKGEYWVLLEWGLLPQTFSHVPSRTQRLKPHCRSAPAANPAQYLIIQAVCSGETFSCFYFPGAQGCWGPKSCPRRGFVLDGLVVCTCIANLWLGGQRDVQEMSLFCHWIGKTATWCLWDRLSQVFLRTFWIQSCLKAGMPVLL